MVMKQPRTLDEARAAFPSSTFYIVAGPIGGPEGRVSLELVTENGEALGWEAPTEAEAWALAFPGKTREVAEPVDPPVWPPTEQMQREAAAANPAPIGLFD